MTNQKIHNALETIKSYSVEAAESVKPCLNSANLQSYKNFLNGMYHYTLTSGNKLSEAARLAPNAELKEFFEHMFREERLHYVLAEQDLKGFNLKPDYNNTPTAVAQFNEFWASLKKQHFNSYLGALYIFENVAEKVTSEIKNMLSRLELNEKQIRWLSIHAEADIEHGQGIADLLTKYLEENTEAAIEAAKEARDRWIAVITSAFQNDVVLENAVAN